jgi:large subunit ribosomal protein L31e
MAKEINQEKIEREYIIPLREKTRPAPRYKKTPKAIKSIKEFLVRHMKVRDRDLNKIKIDKYLNEYIWKRGIKNPVHKIKVKVIKQGDIVKVELVNVPDKLKFKKLREERLDQSAAEAVQRKKSLMQKAKESLKAEDKKEEISEEKKEEEKEKEKAVEEVRKQIEENLHKQRKHETTEKSPKQKKNDKVGYNKSSRGK